MSLLHGVSCCEYPGDQTPAGAFTDGSRSLYMNLRPHYPTHGGGMPPLLNGVAVNSSKVIVVAVQIETADALANKLDEILAVAELDVAFIGRPGDLNSSMGRGRLCAMMGLAASALQSTLAQSKQFLRVVVVMG